MSLAELQHEPVLSARIIPSAAELEERPSVGPTWDVPLELVLKRTVSLLKEYVQGRADHADVERSCRVIERGGRLFSIVRFISSGQWLLLELGADALSDVTFLRNLAGVGRADL